MLERVIHQPPPEEPALVNLVYQAGHTNSILEAILKVLTATDEYKMELN